MADHPPPTVESLQKQLLEAREEAELNLLQLQQVKEELEFYFLAHQQQAEQLARYRELQQQTETLVDALLSRLERGG
jgi:hypothetical protein